MSLRGFLLRLLKPCTEARPARFADSWGGKGGGGSSDGGGVGQKKIIVFFSSTPPSLRVLTGSRQNYRRCRNLQSKCLIEDLRKNPYGNECKPINTDSHHKIAPSQKQQK